MNRANDKWCERESDVVRCLRMGPLSPELRDHVLSCVVCEETQAAAQVIAGKEDWGSNRTIGGPMNIGKTGFPQFKGVHMVERAGHWAHEEQPEKVSELLTAFLREGG